MKIKPSEVSSIIKERIENFDSGPEFVEIGKVLSIGDGVARVYGLEGVFMGEKVIFESGVNGMAMNLGEDTVDVVLFGEDRLVHVHPHLLRVQRRVGTQRNAQRIIAAL